MSALDLFSFAPVKFPLENGNDVYLKRLPAAAKVEWLDYMTARSNQDSVTGAVGLDDSARLLQKAVCDETGALLFTGDEGLAAIKQIDNVTLDALLQKAMQINGMGKAAQDEVEKKSETTPGSTDS